MEVYILIDRRPVIASFEEWARFLSDVDRRVALTEVAAGISVSTVFVGVNMNYSGFGPPMLFETMSFTDYGAGDRCRRYSTWNEAMAGHQEEVAMMLASISQ